MGINLGFENLGMAPKASGELSYEYLDSLIQFNQAASDVLDLCHELTATVRTYDNVNAISKCIKKYGVTRSLEALYGENFSSAASMEAENEEAKKGLGQKIKEIINMILNKIREFWRWITDSGERAVRAMQKAEFKGPFDWEDGKITTKANFDAKRDELFKAFNAAKQAMSDAEKKLKGIQSKPNPTQEEVLGAKGDVEDKTKALKAIIKKINNLVASSKKGKGGKDDQKAVAGKSKEESDKEFDDKVKKEQGYDPNESGLSGGESLRR